MNPPPPLSAGRNDAALDLLLQALRVGPQRLRALGGSMWPSIPHGTCVELRRPAPDVPIVLGEVLAVRTPEGRFLIHRVVGLRGDGHFLLKGDHCPGPDGWFAPHCRLAQVGRMERAGAWVEVSRRATPPPRGVSRLWGALRRRLPRGMRSAAHARASDYALAP